MGLGMKVIYFFFYLFRHFTKMSKKLSTFNFYINTEHIVHSSLSGGLLVTPFTSHNTV